MENEDKATPRPWRVDDRRRAPLPNISIVGADESRVAEANGVHMRDKMLRWKAEDANTADGRAMANTELIVKAVNSFSAFEAMKDALESILKEAEFVGDAKAPFTTWVAEKCRAALDEQNSLR